MTTIDRCTCIPHYQDAGAGLTEYVPEWDPSCSEHGEVDHILKSGEYFDRTGELWHLCDCPADGCGNWHMNHPSRGITPAQMRLLIERDQHRDVCKGIGVCLHHPVPHVARGIGEESGFTVFWAQAMGSATGFATVSAAMEAARALAVKP